MAKISKSLCSRRVFIQTLSALPAIRIGFGADPLMPIFPDIRTTKPCGPGSRYVPKVKAAFVRRKEDYGMLWPGAIYDGTAALENYSRQLRAAATELGLDLDLRSSPIFSREEASAWAAEAKAQKPDGLVLLLLDRQMHAWPTVSIAADTMIPTVVYSPIGTAFTTNTEPVARRTGLFIASTDDFSQAVFGLKMLRAGTKLRETRFVVLQGIERRDAEVHHIGTRLRYVPAQAFLDEYNRTSLTEEIRTLAADYIRRATRISGPTPEDVQNGVKSYVVARNFLEREEADGITMDCLGALGKTKVSLPCIAWSRMLDDGVPAACEADIGACVTHALVQFLFDRPGFEQDPVPETARQALIGAHCTCPTRLNGYSQPPEPYSLAHHHGNRDAVPIPVWREGQRVTVACVVPTEKSDQRPEMIISSGSVLENVAVPPAGGCVVSVMVKLDGVSDLLDYPGFHQIFFYGDYKRQLRDYCRLFDLRATSV